MFNTFLVEPLFNLLAFLYAVIPGQDFGVAVIALTIIVRLLLWPIVNKQLHSQRAIQRLQPEVVRIKSEAKGDRQLESKMLMELYKEKGVNPFGSLLPLFIQLPIFFALYIVLIDIIKPGEIAQLAYPYIKTLEPIKDIIEGGGAFTPMLAGLVNLTQASPVLAALAGLAQFFQTKQLTPQAAPGDTQAQTLRAMIYIFPFITFIIGLTLPSALALYWIVTSLIGILQQTIVLRRDAREMDPSITRADQLGTGTPADDDNKSQVKTPSKTKAKKKKKKGKS